MTSRWPTVLSVLFKILAVVLAAWLTINVLHIRSYLYAPVAKTQSGQTVTRLHVLEVLIHERLKQEQK